MPNPKPLLRLTLALACAAVILWLGAGCGEDIDPHYPCGQESLLYAKHVREVFLENRRLFRRQPGFWKAVERFYRSEQGEWSDKYGIVIGLDEKVEQDTLPPEDRIPDEIDGVPIYFDEGPSNYVGGLIEGVYEKHPEHQYAAAVMWKHDDLFFRQPNMIMVPGFSLLYYSGKPDDLLSMQINVSVTERVSQGLLPPADRIPECLDGVPVRIFEN